MNEKSDLIAILDAVGAPAAPTSFNSAKYYSQFLTDGAREVYDIIEQQLRADLTRKECSFTLEGISYEAAKKNIHEAIQALFLDCTILYLFPPACEIVTKRIGRWKAQVCVCFQTMEERQLRRFVPLLRQELDRLTARLPRDDRALMAWAIFRRVAAYKYPKPRSDGGGFDSKLRCLQTLVLHAEGVCRAQAEMLLLAYRRIGIQAILAENREEDDSGHCWIVGEIDGQLYHFDPTWDLGTGRYFALSDAEIMRDHLMTDSRIPLCPTTLRDRERIISKFI